MTTRRLTTAGLLIAISVLLPQLFHLFGGPALGRIFLPMHLGIFLTGLIAGGWYGVAAGLIAPILSFALTGMPGPPTLFFMLCELPVYGAVCGFLRFGERLEQRTYIIYPKLLIAMVVGRIASGLAMAVGVWLFHLPIEPVSAVAAALVAGLPGLALQIVLIPAIYLLLKRGGYVYEPQTAGA